MVIFYIQYHCLMSDEAGFVRSEIAMLIVKHDPNPITLFHNYENPVLLLHDHSNGGAV